jgi:hypothetical protein
MQFAAPVPQEVAGKHPQDYSRHIVSSGPYDLAEFGARSPVRFQPKNSDGWFRVDLRKGWIERAEVLFIKVKA